MTKLCARGKAAAKSKFKVYPSAYANAYASKICAGKAKDPSGVKRKDWGPKKKSKGGEMTKTKKKMPKARDMAMGDKNITYLGDPFIVDGKKFDPAKKFPKTYMRPEGAKTYSKGSIVDHAKTHRPRMTTETDQEYKKRTEYNGSYIKSEIGGKKVSNKSYEDYYKDLL